MRRIIAVLGLAWAAKKVFSDNAGSDTKDIANAKSKQDKAEV